MLYLTLMGDGRLSRVDQIGLQNYLTVKLPLFIMLAVCQKNTKQICIFTKRMGQWIIEAHTVLNLRNLRAEEVLKQAYMDVFINCPFDDSYYILLKHMIFTVLFLGHKPRLALEETDCSGVRIAKIMSLIESSHISIHDISRMRASRKGEYSRLNLSFELGLDFGCKRYFESMQGKKMLILEKDRYDYQKSISDISGFDIKHHNNDSTKLIEVLRNWFVENQLSICKSSPNTIFNNYCYFSADLYDKRKGSGYTEESLNELPIAELTLEMTQWIKSTHK